MLPYLRIHLGATPNALECRELLSVREVLTHCSMNSILRFCLLQFGAQPPNPALPGAWPAAQCARALPGGAPLPSLFPASPVHCASFLAVHCFCACCNSCNCLHSVSMRRRNPALEPSPWAVRYEGPRAEAVERSNGAFTRSTASS